LNAIRETKKSGGQSSQGKTNDENKVVIVLPDNGRDKND
jgi:hypothetical protein